MLGARFICLCHFCIFFSFDCRTTVQKHITHYPLHHGYEEDKNPWHKHSKLIFLLVAWFLSMAFMSGEDEKVLHRRLLSIDEYQTKSESIHFIFRVAKDSNKKKNTSLVIFLQIICCHLRNLRSK